MGGRLTPTKLALFALCGYEATALATGLAPTITELMWRLPPSRRALVLVGVAVWTVDHFFNDRSQLRRPPCR